MLDSPLQNLYFSGGTMMKINTDVDSNKIDVQILRLPITPVVCPSSSYFDVLSLFPASPIENIENDVQYNSYRRNPNSISKVIPNSTSKVIPNSTSPMYKALPCKTQVPQPKSNYILKNGRQNALIKPKIILTETSEDGDPRKDISTKIYPKDQFWNPYRNFKTLRHTKSESNFKYSQNTNDLLYEDVLPRVKAKTIMKSTLSSLMKKRPHQHDIKEGMEIIIK